MGKWAVIYSSVTGNTKKIAEAMAEAVGADCDVFRVQEAPEDVSDYDVVLLGYWLRLGAPDPLMLKYLPKVHGTRVCFFQTHGTDPTSEHAVTSFARGLSARRRLRDHRHVRLPRQDPAGAAREAEERRAGRSARRREEPGALAARVDASRCRRRGGGQGIHRRYAAQDCL